MNAITPFLNIGSSWLLTNRTAVCVTLFACPIRSLAALATSGDCEYIDCLQSATLSCISFSEKKYAECFNTNTQVRLAKNKNYISCLPETEMKIFASVKSSMTSTRALTLSDHSLRSRRRCSSAARLFMSRLHATVAGTNSGSRLSRDRTQPWITRTSINGKIYEISWHFLKVRLHIPSTSPFFFVSGTSDLFNVEQRHGSASKAFLDGTKNGDVNLKCKRSFSYFTTRTIGMERFLDCSRFIFLKFKKLWLIYIAGDELRNGLGLGFLSYTEIGSRDQSPSLRNVNISCIVQCIDRFWNQNPGPCPSLSLSM